jgi:membrane-associated phospholipid phosphatase
LLRSSIPLAHEDPLEGDATGWVPAGRAELVALGIFFVLVIVISDVINVRPGIEFCIIMVSIAGTSISRLRTQFFKDWWFFLVGMVMWNLSGPVAAQSPFPWHLDFMYNTDRSIFLGHNPVSMLHDVMHLRRSLGPLDYLTAAGYNLHLPEPFMVAYFLWRLNRAIYFQFVAATLVVLVLGLITFILFPAVPPWLAGQPLVRFEGQYLKPWVAAASGYPGGLHAAWQHTRVLLPDITNRFGLVLASHPLPFVGSPLFYIFKFRGDQVAAFPSEHAAFPLLEYFAIRAAAPRVAWAMVLWVLFVLFTIVYLGEHWVTDAIAGYVLAIVVWTCVRWYTARRSERTTETT